MRYIADRRACAAPESALGSIAARGLPPPTSQRKEASGPPQRPATAPIRRRVQQRVPHNRDPSGTLSIYLDIARQPWPTTELALPHRQSRRQRLPVHVREPPTGLPTLSLPVPNTVGRGDNSYRARANQTNRTPTAGKPLITPSGSGSTSMGTLYIF